jgi:hypothetical protein
MELVSEDEMPVKVVAAPTVPSALHCRVDAAVHRRPWCT